jgi:hypothetical protein
VYTANAEGRGRDERAALRRGLAEFIAHVMFARPWLAAPDPAHVAADLKEHGWTALVDNPALPTANFRPRDAEYPVVSIPITGDGAWPERAAACAQLVAAYERTEPAAVLTRWLRGPARPPATPARDRASATAAVLAQADISVDTASLADAYRGHRLGRLAQELDQAARGLDSISTTLTALGASVPVHADRLAAMVKQAGQGRLPSGNYLTAIAGVSDLAVVFAQYTAAHRRLTGLAATWNAAALTPAHDADGERSDRPAKG